MSLQFSINNRYFGLGKNPSPVFCLAWYNIKTFLVNQGWTVSQSGYYNSQVGSNFGQMDLITNPGYLADPTDPGYVTGAGGMASDKVWFVLRSPDAKRELLFYRHVPIDTSSDTKPGSKTSYRTAGIMAIAYSAQSRFSTSVGVGYYEYNIKGAKLTGVTNGSALIDFSTATFTIIDSNSNEVTLPSSPVDITKNIGNIANITGGNIALKNNGSYKISAMSSTTLTVFNPLATIDTTGDLNINIKQPLSVSGSIAPMAADMIWLHKRDTADLNFYTNNLGDGDIINWSGAVETGDALSDYDIWNLHICAENSVAPYPFYFWFTNKRDTLGFFAMDAMLDGNSGDTDQVSFWFCPITGGIGGYPTTGMDVLNGTAPFGYPNQWSPHFIDLTAHSTAQPRLRGWLNKPSTFSSSTDSIPGRNDFISKVGQNKCRFLDLMVPVLSMHIYLDSSSGVGTEDFYTFAPRGNSTSLYSDALHPPQDQLFPVMYFKFASYQSYAENGDGSNFELLSVPNSYKGRSTLFKMNSVSRNQFDTLTISNPKDAIMCGSSAEIVIPWKTGFSINKP